MAMSSLQRVQALNWSIIAAWI